MSDNFFITIAGNMGVGKSSLTKRLAEKLGWTPFYEAVDDNPYIADFFKDMRRWSFHSQMFFLSRRMRLHREMTQQSGSVIQDRSIYEDANIFARNLYEVGDMSQRDYDVYRAVYEEAVQVLPPPHLIVYLKARVPTLIGRVQQRGREYERDISPLYLQQLNELYNSWIEDFTLCPILTIETDHMNFVRSDKDFDYIVDMVAERLAIRVPVAALV
ncbi:MAG: deoxynucleoside kinase [Anaerolineae bacterium]|nr:deoxynucleoside kinase [Anaerolineae bacterium]